MMATSDLVRILDEHIFSFGHLHAKIGNSPHDTPSICQGNVELTRKLGRTDRCSTEDDVPSIVSGCGARDVSEKMAAVSS